MRQQQALAVAACIQLLILAGLAFGEYPRGYWQTFRILIALYAGLDVLIFALARQTRIFGRPLTRVAVYLLQLIVCFIYALIFSAVR